MGKEKTSFQLKTPKGTKDCMLLALVSSLPETQKAVTDVTDRGWQRHGHSRPDLLRDHQSVQTSRCGDDRYVCMKIDAFVMTTTTTTNTPAYTLLCVLGQAGIRTQRDPVGEVWRGFETHLRSTRSRWGAMFVEI